MPCFFVCQVAPLHQRNKALIAAIHAGGHDFKLLPQLLGAKVQIGCSPSGGLDVRYDYGSTKSIQCLSFRIIRLVLPMIQSVLKNNSEPSTGHQTVKLDAVDFDPAKQLQPEVQFLPCDCFFASLSGSEIFMLRVVQCGEVAQTFSHQVFCSITFSVQLTTPQRP